MSVLQLFKRGTELSASVTRPAEVVDLAELLKDLTNYGRPRLGVYSERGWHCSVEMHTTAIGVRFEAKSEFNHATPTEAAIVCRDRIRAALAAIGK